MGKLIVIEGLDGTGKTTQVEKLATALNNLGHKTLRVNFPAYGKPSCSLVEMYLHGEFGASPDDVNPYAASTFYAVDRYASYMTGWKKPYEEGTIILSDRYISANVIYQSAKITDEADRKRFYTWLYEFEVGLMGIPRETATIALYAEPESLNNLILSRYKGEESKKDIHESNLEYLTRCYDTLLEASGILGWDATYIGDTHGGILGLEEIHQLLLHKVERLLSE